jgi:RsiW-degrading membrane proteinase PrsW (M82 family)
MIPTKNYKNLEIKKGGHVKDTGIRWYLYSIYLHMIHDCSLLGVKPFVTIR